MFTSGRGPPKLTGAFVFINFVSPWIANLTYSLGVSSNGYYQEAFDFVVQCGTTHM